MKIFWLTFWTVFIAELGDKTQLATLLLASKSTHRWLVFLGAALALILTSALGVLAGKLMAGNIPEKYLKILAGIAFIIMGIAILTGKL